MPRTGRTRAGRRRAGANAQGHAQRGAPVRTLADLASAVERLSPCRLAAEWDRTGVLIGDSGDPVSRVLLTIDLTEAVLDEARDRDGAGRGTGARTGPRARAVRGTAVVAYHPPIFEPLANLAADEPRGRIVLRAARELAGVISPHTALDAVAGGVNDWLAEGIGAGVLSPIEPASAAPSGEAFLVCTKTPRIALDAVRDAMSLAGAGRIGAYSRCSFEIQGEGTFQGDASTNPAVGFARRFVRAPEVKLEMVSSAAALPAALAALRTAHPYEEPAIEVLPLAPRPSIREGQGRVLELLRPTTAPEIASRLARHLRLPRGSIELVEATSDGARGRRAAGRSLRGHAAPARHARIGLCPGSGGSLVPRAIELGCTLFVTGEMKHHERLDAAARGCSVLLAGHTETERGFLPRYRSLLAAQMRGVPIVVSSADRPPAIRNR